MDLDGSKEVCGICGSWEGPRERDGGRVQVKASAKGKCLLQGKIKTVQGGCGHWQRWEKEEAD